MEKTNFDERQERQLLGIEKRGCTIAWWGQWVIFGRDFSRLGGELAVFIPLTVYLGAASLLNGLRDRYWPAAWGGKILVSLLLGLGMALLNAAAVLLHPQRAWESPAAMFLLLFFGAFMLSFLALVILQALADRKKRRLEREPEEDE